MEQIQYFEDYEIGSSRLTSGRTITETDFKSSAAPATPLAAKP